MPNKTYEILVPPKDPAAIVAAIECFVEDGPQLSGKRLHDPIIRRFEPAAFGRHYRALVEELLECSPATSATRH